MMLIIASYSQGLAQERPMRIGAKLGIPNISGLHFEYVTPWLDGKLAPSLDISYIPLNASSFRSYKSVDNGIESFYYSYVELGLNYYFFKQGRGLYTNVSLARAHLDFSFSDYQSDESGKRGGVGELDVNLNLINFKLGAKLGKTFYFRPEIGVSVIGGNVDDFNFTVTYPDGTTERVDADDISDVLISLTPVFNIGFGFAF
ncbi:hypothetical protein PZB74_03815 [Porifericola rhodea]|uniref:hypothetical protein n=1 Tax=Porifericola rhodea TaxID=930972 RepID=UPI0026659BBC|nr:hypothetical protein [Porifericola rhodea]WKN32473.1 hypothetical protein PZB74_03815 [Porifericola rhodea]